MLIYLSNQPALAFPGDKFLPRPLKSLIGIFKSRYIEQKDLEDLILNNMFSNTIDEADMFWLPGGGKKMPPALIEYKLFVFGSGLLIGFWDWSFCMRVRDPYRISIFHRF